MLDKIQTHYKNEFMLGKVLAYNSVFKTWSVEHYSKCSFRCAYCCCDSQGKSTPTVDPVHLIELLDKDMHDAALTGFFIPKETGVILSCHTDPYIPLESDFLLTRKIIEHFIHIDQPFSIVTRGTTIQRDLDLLTQHKKKCDVSFSLPVINPAYLKKFEPHTPPIEERINAIIATHDAGIKVTVRIDPWIPGATEVEAILGCLPEKIDVLVSPLLLSEVFKADDGIQEHNETPVTKRDQRNNPLFNKYLGFAQQGFCQTATKLFSHLSQSDINREYVQARNRAGFQRHVKWFYPPEPGKNITEIAYRFLKPDEIPS